MKKLLLILFLITCSISFAQEPESVKPTFGVEIERYIDYASINGRTYTDVIVNLKAAAMADLFADGVKVVIRDANNKIIYKKRFHQSLLYGFSDGTIEVGKGNILTQITIFKNNNKWHMKMREKGLY